MKQVFSAILLVLGFSLSAEAVCKNHKTTGIDYFGAKYNCEAILGGYAQNCQPGNAQGTIWYCSCMTNCNNGGGNFSSPKVTTTMGADYFGAKYNCEAVLNGYALSCQPGNAQGTIWSCRCQY